MKDKIKIKISKKDINSIFALLTIITLMVLFVIMFFPEIVEYKYSIGKLSDRKNDLDFAVMELRSNESSIKNLEDDIAIKLREVEDLEEEINKLDSIVSVDRFNLHVPSLFVTLESAARARDLDLTILYDKFNADPDLAINGLIGDMKDLEGNLYEGLLGEIESENDDILEPEEVNEDTNEEVEIEDEIEETNNEEDIDQEDNANNEIDEDSFIEETIEDEYVIKFATIPIVIVGDFLKARDFIRSLDELDFVEATQIEINSDASSIKAGILLKIYYGEGDMS